MVIKINNTEIELKQTFRAHIIYEQITGNTFSAKNVTDIITFYYSTVMAANPKLVITFDEFIGWLDEDPPKTDTPKTIKQPTKKKRLQK